MIKTLSAVLFLLTAALAPAQTATFTFGPAIPPPYPNPPQSCGSILSWDGVADAYPQNMGAICLAIYPVAHTDISIPWQLGFPNNGYLTGCATTPIEIGFGTLGFVDNGDGTGSQPFTAGNCYDGLNTAIVATVQFKRIIHTSCGRGGCHTFYSWQVTGGSGTVSNQPTAAILREQRIQADLDNDPCEPIILFPWDRPDEPVVILGAVKQDITKQR